MGTPPRDCEPAPLSRPGIVIVRTQSQLRTVTAYSSHEGIKELVMVDRASFKLALSDCPSGKSDVLHYTTGPDVNNIKLIPVLG